MFPEMKSLLVLAHLFGVVLGAGGAFMSDAMFLSSVKDERVTATELRFMRLGGRMVWAGVALLVLSGAALVLTDPGRYLASDRFWAKMTVVAVIIVNGLVFHARHIPLLLRHAGHHFPSSDEFIRNRPFILASGALSMTSWVTALVLGSLSGLSLPYAAIIGAYGIIAILAAATAIALRDAILPHHHFHNSVRRLAERLLSLIDGR